MRVRSARKILSYLALFRNVLILAVSCPYPQYEYLAAENRILKARLQPGWRLSDGERATLAEIGRRLGRKGLQPVARLARPDTILAW